jgi:hypothetical protein
MAAAGSYLQKAIGGFIRGTIDTTGKMHVDETLLQINYCFIFKAQTFASLGPTRTIRESSHPSPID